MYCTIILPFVLQCLPDIENNFPLKIKIVSSQIAQEKLHQSDQKLSSCSVARKKTRKGQNSNKNVPNSIPGEGGFLPRKLSMAEE
jgi:hypothetical protein